MNRRMNRRSDAQWWRAHKDKPEYSWEYNQAAGRAHLEAELVEMRTRWGLQYWGELLDLLQFH
jgi:hypothetical protein